MNRLSVILLAILVTFIAMDCGNDATLVIVDTENRPSTAKRLRLSATLDGRIAMMPEEIADGLDEFGVLLPEGAEGAFLLGADGLDEGRCIVAQGTTDTVLTGRKRERLLLPIQSIQVPICPR